MSWRANKQKYSWPFSRASQILKQKKIAALIFLRELAGHPKFFLQAQNSGGAPLKTENVAFKNNFWFAGYPWVLKAVSLTCAFLRLPTLLENY